MTEHLKKATINSSAEDVWMAISDFNGFGKFIPAIENSTMKGSGTGAIRTITLGDGGKIIETLIGFNEPERSLSYEINESPLPIEGYVSVMKVKEISSDKCELFWSSVFEPKDVSDVEAKEIIEGFYSMGIEGLKKMVFPDRNAP